MSDPDRWTTPADITASVRRRWTDGELLRSFVGGSAFPRIDIPLRGPRAADLGTHFDEARAWADGGRTASRNGRAFEVVYSSIGGRISGATDVPARALVSTYEQAWTILGTAREATTFRELIEASHGAARASAWALSSPLAAITLAPEWPAVLAAYAWLDSHRDSGFYLRHVSAPGVDTKFIERHRRVLAALLDVPAGKGLFESALGLAAKPPTVRLRFDPAVFGFPGDVTEAALRTDELRRVDTSVRRAIIVENEITYLSVPVMPGSVVLWGKGYDVGELASLEWLALVDVDYWGDLDTHGFGILNRVRKHLPHARSVLMDRETLLAHEPRWGHDSKATNVALSRLTTAESALYADLVSDRFGRAVQLEQERIDWEWALQRLEAIG